MSNINNQFWRVGSVFALIAQMMNANPKLGYAKAKSMAGFTKRIRVSRYQPHYGEQAAARNRRHAAAFTHGLQTDFNGSIVFG